LIKTFFKTEKSHKILYQIKKLRKIQDNGGSWLSPLWIKDFKDSKNGTFSLGWMVKT